MAALLIESLSTLSLGIAFTFTLGAVSARLTTPSQALHASNANSSADR
jgi:hypothetical protein